jgi:hypothetical protein
MERMSAEQFLTQVLETVPNLPNELREKLISLARRASTSRSSQLVRAYQENSGG